MCVCVCVSGCFLNKQTNNALIFFRSVQHSFALINDWTKKSRRRRCHWEKEKLEERIKGEKRKAEEFGRNNHHQSSSFLTGSAGQKRKRKRSEDEEKNLWIASKGREREREREQCTSIDEFGRIIYQLVPAIAQRTFFPLLLRLLQSFGLSKDGLFGLFFICLRFVYFDL